MKKIKPFDMQQVISKKITPEKAQAILAKHGMDMTLAKVAIVLDFLYCMAVIDVANFLEEK